MTHRLREQSLKWTRAALIAISLVSVSGLMAADKPATAEASGTKIGFVNFRKAVEESKLGKAQQSAFEAMQNQMEASLLELQKGLNEITTKLSDEDYLDGLSPEAENELKHKYRAMTQELTRTQSQYMQTLQDANMKVLQLISAEVADAAKEVASVKGLDLIVNEEAAFYHKPSMDLSSQVVAQMDAKYEREQKKGPTPAAGQKPADKSAPAANSKGK
jgi:outer membrane protein